jgi:hypothetical protein
MYRGCLESIALKSLAISEAKINGKDEEGHDDQDDRAQVPYSYGYIGPR